MASIRRRKRKKKDVWVVDYRDGAGRRHVVTCRTRREADIVQAQKTLESRQVSLSPVVDPHSTVRAYAGRWLRLLAATVKPKTLRSYEQNLRLHILPALGGVRVAQLRVGLLRSFLLEKLGSGRSRNTIRIVRATLSAMLSAAVDDELLIANPAFGLGRKLGRRRAVHEEPRVMTGEQLERFLRAATESDGRHYPLLMLLARTGLRIGEALGLKWSDCDLQAREIHVRRTLEAIRRGTSPAERLGAPKSGKARTVDVSHELADELRRLELAQKSDALRLGAGRLSPWVFSTGEGTPLDESRVRKAFKRLLKLASLPRTLSPHSLRHTYAILMIQAGAPLTYVRDQLGHSSIKVTVDIYGRWLPRGDKTWVDRLDQSSESQRFLAVGEERGGGGQDPTGDQLVTNLDLADEMLPQVVETNGADERTRTADLLITKHWQMPIRTDQTALLQVHPDHT
jgi:integrase